MRLGPAALARAVVVYRCPTPHTHTVPAAQVITFSDSFRVMDFADDTVCPDCLDGCHVVGIEWEPPE